MGLVVVSVLGVFVLVPDALSCFMLLSKEYAYLMSFMKFAVLATFGECLACRITSGCYVRDGFGLLPKFVVWGGLGVVIKVAFVVFSTGTPNVLASLGLSVDAETIQAGSHGMKILIAFSVSVCLNLIFAPVMMTLHKITDLHIHEFRGELIALLRPIDVVGILKRVDWETMFHFVFKITIPFFWIPAHTITFLLPSEFQILFAAVLSIALGLILAIAANKKEYGCCVSRG